MTRKALVNNMRKPVQSFGSLIVVAVLGCGLTSLHAADEVGKRKLPRMVDLGAKQCIPCKMMAPILAQLKKEYAGRFEVEFIDVWIRENVPKAKAYKIRAIPTQVFISPEGKELWRHEGFLGKDAILAKWKELGYDFAAEDKTERWTPARADTRDKSTICYMCDGAIDKNTAVEVKTEKGRVRLCGLHCYFIMYSSLTQDKAGFEETVRVTDWSTGKEVPLLDAVFLTGIDERNGRPWIRAFADRPAAEKQRAVAGGSIVGYAVLRDAELSHRCGFCDRSCYPADAAKVIAGGVHTWGCCSHCALGVAARTGKDIIIHQPDGLTGEMIVVKTMDGQIASIEPKTAVAWFGMRKQANGKWGSAGCFHQGFFTTAEHLKKWLDKNPQETGKMITIAQALADKMKLSPQQIQNACKIGECAPK